MIKYYKNLKRDKTPPYAIFQAQEADTIITLYESGKAMFQGICADIDANIWIDQEKRLNNRDIDIKTGKDKKEKKDNTIQMNFNKFNTIGSDEVGTGDYFGPIVVAASYVSVKDVSWLKELKVDDSKKMTDEAILNVAPKIMEKIPFSAFILTNEAYNNIDHKLVNMNKIKAILHNKVLTNMVNKELAFDKIVVDQFTPPKNYYGYLSDVPNPVKNITFTPKAESLCLSVACASVISRYIFLSEMHKLSIELGNEIPKGAGEGVDSFAKEIMTTKGKDVLKNYVKWNFKNTEKLHVE